MKKLTVPALALLLLVGCGLDPGKNPEPVEVSGRVTLKGRPLSDVIVNFQATGKGAQATFPVKEGAFRGSMVPGTYTYSLAEGKNPAAFQAVPTKYRQGSLERQVEVEPGTIFHIALD